MKHFFRSLLAASCAICLTQPAHAELRYGSWIKTSVCRDLIVKDGPVLGKMPVPLPNRVLECKWEREIEECQGFDKLKHPIKCFKRKETSGYSVNTPPR
jgi:hypothetical protein